MTSCVFLDADSFDPDEPIKKVSVHDKWEGEDEEEDVKVFNVNLSYNFTFKTYASVNVTTCSPWRNVAYQEPSQLLVSLN